MTTQTKETVKLALYEMFINQEAVRVGTARAKASADAYRELGFGDLQPPVDHTPTERRVAQQASKLKLPTVR